MSLGDDRYEKIPIGFAFPYQGEIWRDVFVNANGNLTFGTGSTDWTESVPDLLNGPARIAALWDDLIQDEDSVIKVTHKKNSVTIEYNNMGEFWTGDRNTFSITLYQSGKVEIVYGDCQSDDGLAGISQGNSAADPGPTDLSAAEKLSVSGTAYEIFTLDSNPDNDFDLSNKNLRFSVPEL